MNINSYNYIRLCYLKTTFSDLIGNKEEVKFSIQSLWNHQGTEAYLDFPILKDGSTKGF